MAQVPTLSGPSVSPSAAPTPTQNITPPPSAFGANVVGEGLGELGKAAGATSEALTQYATNVQAIVNKQAADTHGLDTAQKVGQLYSQWRENNTQDRAVATFPDFQAKVEELHSAGRAGLSPLAAADYDQLSRRYVNSYLSEAASYSAQQGHLAGIAKANANAETAGQLYATNPTPETEAAFLQQAGNSAQQFFASAGLEPDDPQVHQKLLQYTSPAYSAVIKNTYDGGDLTGARTLLAQHATNLTPEAYASISGALRVATQANTRQTEAKAILDGGTLPVGGGHGGPAQSAAASSATTHFEAQGWSPAVSAALTAGMYHESGISSNPRGSNDGGSAFGAMQWHGPRQADFEAWAGHSIRTSTLAEQQDFTNYELTQGKYKAVGAQLRSGDLSAAQASDIITRGYLAPANQTAPALAERARTAEAIAGGRDFGSNGGSAGAHVQFAPLPAPSLSQDPEQYLSSASTKLQTEAETLHPDNVAEQRAVYEAGMQLARERVYPIQTQQKANYDSIGKWVTENNVQDISQVQTKFPNEWQSMPAAYQNALEHNTQYNANVITPQRNINIEKLNGELALAGVNPSPFLSENIRAADLPLAMQREFLQKQANLAQNKVQTDTVVQHAMSSVQGRAALDALQIRQPTGGQYSDQYYQFAGALQAQVEAFRSAPGNAAPQSKDLDAMITQITAKQGGMLGFRTHPVFEVPAADAQRIREAYKSRGLGEPTQQDIGRQYAISRGRGNQ